jgi:hypothetical protein
VYSFLWFLFHVNVFSYTTGTYIRSVPKHIKHSRLEEYTIYIYHFVYKMLLHCWCQWTLLCMEWNVIFTHCTVSNLVCKFLLCDKAKLCILYFCIGFVWAIYTCRCVHNLILQYLRELKLRKKDKKGNRVKTECLLRESNSRPLVYKTSALLLS